MIQVDHRLKKFLCMRLQCKSCEIEGGRGRDAVSGCVICALALSLRKAPQGTTSNHHLPWRLVLTTSPSCRSWTSRVSTPAACLVTW